MSILVEGTRLRMVRGDSGRITVSCTGADGAPRPFEEGETLPVRHDGGDIMTVLEMAKQYYPRLWSRERIEALVAAGRLTPEEAEEVYLSADSR